MFGKMTYPKTRVGDVVDDYFGAEVPDPYRWLEDEANPEVLAWTNAQHDFAMEMLNGMAGRATFERRLSEVWDYPKHDIPRERGGRLFYLRNDGLQNQPKLYVREADGEERMLIDSNALSDDGTIAIFDWKPTADGGLVLYALSESGMDWLTFRVLNVETGEDLPDKIDNIKFSVPAWRPDGSGFYYSRFEENARDEGDDNQAVSQQLYFHRLGEDQTDDEMVYAHPDIKGVTLAAEVSSDGRYLIVYVHRESKLANRMYCRAIDGAGEFLRLFDDLDAEYALVGSDGDTFYVRTTNGAPNQRVIAVDITDPAPENWLDAVPETRENIAGVAFVNQQFVVTTMRDARHAVKIYNKDGTLDRDLPLPGMGSTLLHAGAYGTPDDDSMFIAWTTYLQPTQILRYDFTSGQLSALFEAAVPSFDPELYETRQVFCRSRDGTAVPLFITARADIDLNGNNPTILYGYGGYNISLTPAYRSWLPVWLENGGVFAVAINRGGGEYGEAWHRAGMLESKQNTFDDFIAAAEWLIESGYTSSGKLAIEGASNGGLLVAACMLQRPDLYGAILCHVPVIDMLRFQFFTSGRYWTSEYGDSKSSAEHFDFQYAISPLHNIVPGQAYPPLLILTADHDDRVVPMHSKKFAAAMQAADETGNFIVMRVESKAGHGMGKPTSKLIALQVDIFAFLNRVFEMGVE